MNDQERMERERETQESGETPAREAEERQAGWREIAAGLFILVVLLGGLTYAWFMGYDTGFADGIDEERGRWLQVPRRVLPVGIAPKHQVLLKDGQILRMTLEGPGDNREDLVLDASDGERIVVAVGKAPPKPQGLEEPEAGETQ